MSDNRKYYYLKLKESYFDDEAIVLLESMQDGMLYSNILLKLYLTSLKYGGMATDFGFSPQCACLCVLVALVREENPPCTQRGCHCSKYQPQSCAGSVADSVQNP